MSVDEGCDICGLSSGVLGMLWMSSQDRSQRALCIWLAWLQYKKYIP